jgi:glycogen debranching enzyme
MDAKVNDNVVTPRIGKNVEINALWYHVLRVAAFFCDLFDDEAAYTAYEMHAQKVKESFESKFWYEELGYLYDTIGAAQPDTSIRPNQIFAISLPHTVIMGEKAVSILECINRFLFTPYGLRSLAPGHPDYKPRYEGDLVSRDFAYHQGTVWAWLMGPYIDALLKVKGESREVAKEGLKILEPLLKHIDEAGLGSISEIFDADPPHIPRGCYTQAWSVAEILRVYIKLLDICPTWLLKKDVS